MDHEGYTWTLRLAGDHWSWAILDARTGTVVLGGEAPSRPVAAAMVIRAIVRGVTAESEMAERIAA
jgi:hypothetical protein